MFELGREAGHHVVAATLGCLEDVDNEVRVTALETLPLIVKAGQHEEVSAAVVGCLKLQKGRGNVRKAALRTLAEVAGASDRSAMAIAVAYLQHPDHGTRIAASEMLAVLAQKATEEERAAVKRFLAHYDSNMRRAGVEKGDQQAVSSFVGRIFSS